VIRVLVVDDDAVLRAGLRVLLEAEPDLRVVAEAADGQQALVAAAEHDPDVVVMDVRMPGLDGLTATSLLTARDRVRPRVLVLTTFEHDGYVYDALRAGASGFLLKRAAPQELTGAVRLVAVGESLLFPALTRRLVQSHRPHAVDAAHAARLAELTPRETEVLRELAAGRSNAEIADALALGLETVKTHVARTLVKLGARDRTQAVIAAYEGGLVRGDGPS